jgi:CBS domain-containing protein
MQLELTHMESATKVVRTEPLSAVLDRKGSQVWSISPDATVYDAIALMAEKHVGALLVMTGDHLDGVISERDYARKVILQGKSSREIRVREIMTSNLVTARPDNTAGEGLRRMTEFRVRHLPVLDRGRVVGVVSIGDLVRSLILAQAETVEQLTSYINGTYPV